MTHNTSRALGAESEPLVKIQETFDSPRERVFDAWVRPERIVFTSVIATAAGLPATPESQGHDPAWPAETVVRVTFTERGGQTVVTLEQSVSEALAKRTGAHPSWLEMFDRLSRHLAGRSE